MPIESGTKEHFFAELKTLIAKAKRLRTSGFDGQEPEAATCHGLILPLLAALGFGNSNIKPEFKILGDSVDYLLKSERPLIFVEAKSLLDKSENLFDGRFRYVDELLRMGANIRTDSHHAVVRGVPMLSGARVTAGDIRAAAALVVAGLRAEGETIIYGARHLDRGYDDLVGKLASVGAALERVS